MSGNKAPDKSKGQAAEKVAPAQAAAATAAPVPKKEDPSEFLNIIVRLLASGEKQQFEGELGEKLHEFKNVAEATLRDSTKSPSTQQLSDTAAKANNAMQKLKNREKSQVTRVEKLENQLQDAQAELLKTREELTKATTEYTSAIGTLSSALTTNQGAREAGTEVQRAAPAAVVAQATGMVPDTRKIKESTDAPVRAAKQRLVESFSKHILKRKAELLSGDVSEKTLQAIMDSEGDVELDNICNEVASAAAEAFKKAQYV